MSAIIKRELSSYFNSAIGYIVLAVFYFFSGMFFYMYCLMSNTTSMTYVFLSMLMIVMLLVPIITMIGNRLSMMLGMTLFVENVFSIPGIGSLMVQSVNNVDMPVLQACVMLSALIISLAYLFTDFLYVVVDPRISIS